MSNVTSRSGSRRRARALVVVLGVAREVEQLREDGAERRRDAEVGEPPRRRAGGDRRRREIDEERAVDEEDAALDGADVHAALADVDAALAEQRARHRALARRAQLGRRVAAVDGKARGGAAGGAPHSATVNRDSDGEAAG